MVRRAAPSKARTTPFTHSRKRISSSLDRRPFWNRASSLAVSLMASHISGVRAVRTARALVRAVDRQLQIDDE